MRDYVAHLPDYTCRVTLERFARRSPRTDFELSDRIRLEVAYIRGQELYAWPGGDRFEAGIEDLLPGHGMVSNGSYALHMKNLFVRNVAAFGAPREERCEGRACARLDFEIPASRSGYSVSAGSSGARAALAGAAWFDSASLDILKLEVRVDDTPPNVRIAATRETTLYARAKIGDGEFVLPATSELVLRDRNGTEARNTSQFDRYRRYSGSSTIFYGAGTDAGAAPAAVAKEAAPAGKSLTAKLDTGIAEDCAIGDEVGLAGRYTARIVGLRRAGKRWLVDLRVGDLVRAGLQVPVASGHEITLRRE